MATLKPLGGIVSPIWVDRVSWYRHTAAMAARDEVLAVNERFYAAFRSRDAEEMAAVWAEEAPVGVIHPGWRALVGRDEVMASWRAIFRNPRAPEVHCQNPVVLLAGEMAIVICTETLNEGALVATNVFVREGAFWRMSHHHAGPGEGVPPDPDDEPGGMLH